MAVEAENSCPENTMSVPFGLYGTTTATQDWFLSDGFSLQETEPLPLLECSGILASSSLLGRNALSGDFVQSLYSELERQRQEIEGFLQLESERLRRMILQQQTRQQGILSQKLEARIKNLLVQKDQELAFARNKTVELQVLLKGAQMEAETWERKATEKEAIAVNLNNRLKNLTRQKHCLLFPNAESAQEEDDAVSFCDSSSSSTEDPQSNCKLCRAQKACVVFFPCRHLCCCKSCESLSEQCLVCGSGKGASLEVFFWDS